MGPSTVPNARLAALVEQSRISHTGLAKRVSDGCARRGVPRAYTATSVDGWLRGRTPQDPAPAVIAELLSARLARPVSVLELGFAITPMPEHLGLDFADAPRVTVETVVEMWEADLLRRDFLAGASALAGAFSAPVRDWLIAGDRESVAFSGTSRRVGSADVDLLWSMCHTFSAADQRLGGGHARTTLMHYAHEQVRPLLGGSYDDEVGRDLFGAAARLADLGGFMAFDSGRYGLAQRYYIQALRLAQLSEDEVLGAHILGDMSMLDHHLGDGREALAQARAGQRSALAGRRKSYSSYARCLALEARAHSRLGNRGACERALASAETAMDRVQPDDEPFWVKFFTARQFHAEAAYAAADLGQVVAVQEHGSLGSAAGDGMERRRILVRSAVAEAHLAGSTPDVDVSEATRVASEVLDLAAQTSSQRGLDAVTRVRRKLANEHSQHPDAQAFEHRARQLLPAAL